MSFSARLFGVIRSAARRLRKPLAIAAQAAVAASGVAILVAPTLAGHLDSGVGFGEVPERANDPFYACVCGCLGPAESVLAVYCVAALVLALVLLGLSYWLAKRPGWGWHASVLVLLSVPGVLMSFLPPYLPLVATGRARLADLIAVTASSTPLGFDPGAFEVLCWIATALLVLAPVLGGVVARLAVGRRLRLPSTRVLAMGLALAWIVAGVHVTDVALAPAAWSLSARGEYPPQCFEARLARRYDVAGVTTYHPALERAGIAVRARPVSSGTQTGSQYVEWTPVSNGVLAWIRPEHALPERTSFFTARTRPANAEDTAWLSTITAQRTFVVASWVERLGEGVVFAEPHRVVWLDGRLVERASWRIPRGADHVQLTHSSAGDVVVGWTRGSQLELARFDRDLRLIARAHAPPAPAELGPLRMGFTGSLVCVEAPADRTGTWWAAFDTHLRPTVLVSWWERLSARIQAAWLLALLIAGALTVALRIRLWRAGRLRRALAGQMRDVRVLRGVRVAAHLMRTHEGELFAFSTPLPPFETAEPLVVVGRARAAARVTPYRDSARTLVPAGTWAVVRGDLEAACREAASREDRARAWMTGVGWLVGFLPLLEVLAS